MLESGRPQVICTPFLTRDHMQSSLKIGIIGAGAMGLAMAKNLHRKHYEVRVRDIAANAVQAAADSGIAACGSSGALAAWADVIAVVVVNAAQIDEALFGSTGVVEGRVGAARREDHSPLAVLLCSTIAPQDSIQLGDRLTQAGIDTLDAPISGGPVRAENGTMTLMVAGHPTLVTRLNALLHDLASRIFVIGETVGDAAKTKLVNNLLAGINLTAGAEALALGHRLGLDRQQLFDVICASSGASWIFEDRMARALRNDYAPRAQAHILTKDVGLAVRMANDAGIGTPLGDVALAIFQATVAAGLSDEDDAAVIKTMHPAFNDTEPPASRS